MICIKRCRLLDRKYIFGVGDIILVDLTENDTSMILEASGKDKNLYPMSTEILKECFITLAEWRDKQIDSILEDD